MVYIDHAGRQQTISLEGDSSRLVIGRHPDCDIRLMDASVSRRHCEIRCGDGLFTIRDLQSANGTRLNDEAIRHEALKDGDIIRCGSFVVQFLHDNTAPGLEALTPQTIDLGEPDAVSTMITRCAGGDDVDGSMVEVRNLEARLTQQEDQIRAIVTAIESGRVSLEEAVMWLRQLIGSLDAG